jgi:glyoxalase family protein
MRDQITGIHHITAIASEPKRNLAFYAGLLGLRLVKKTVNFDDPSAYHLYYGDATGSPGSIVTFFYWPGLEAKGRVGAGQATAIVLSAPVASLDFWQDRLKDHEVEVARRVRFGEEILSFEDPDGIPVEIVAVANDERQGWTGSGIPPQHALRGLHTAELTVRKAQATEDLLAGTMEFRLVKREGNRARFEAGPGGSGHYADVVENGTASSRANGVGTIHHIAWSIPDDASQIKKMKELHQAGFQSSPVMDRDYFHSIYYREKGGILFEIATENPGFAVDEAPESLGNELRLPKQFEKARQRIEQLLPPLPSSKSLASQSAGALAG